MAFLRRIFLHFGLIALVAFPTGAQFLRVYYPDIEQGSATLVVSPTGKAVLVDAGTGIKDVDEGIEHFINDLIDAGVVLSVDYIVATHYDEDHIGRMENVFQYVPLATSIVSYDRGEFMSVPSTFAYSDYSFGASLNNRTTVACSTNAYDLDLGGGATVKFYNVNGEVCGGPTVDVTGASQFENNVSVTLVVQYGDFDIWIGGDLTGNPAKGVADVETPTGTEVMDVDVYTVNHHGSETSSNASFLSDLAAEVAINQSSIENGFGHPRAVIVNRILATPDSGGNTPIFYQQNPGDPNDPDSDDSLADAIADCDDGAAGEVIGLPGTIVLLSDGNSYRVHACGIAATSFSADSGPGTLGDFPPAIRRVLHTPRVPLSTEGVTVEADIEDVSTAQIRYWLDGVEQPSISMSLGSGITFTGTIPAQADGARVEFRISATDSSSQTELSQEGCYYSGVTPISTLRINDADGVLQHLTCGVRVEGNMTAEPGVFHPTVTQAWVQDATGGLQVFDKTIDATIQRGDVVRWTGELEQFAGLTEVIVAEDFGNFGSLRIGSGSPPSPQVVTVSQVGESTEGKLIRINNVSVVAGAIPETGNGSFTVTDDGGISTLEVRIDRDTDIPGANTPSQAFDIVGLSGQFDSWVALDDGYQLAPREAADILSDEVNFAAVVISEIHADPAGSIAGDANGDGARSATADEFVELLNTTTSSVDISGWTIRDAGGIRHTFAAGTLLPPREATVVFGGGVPAGDFGNAAANSLVFTASSGGLSLNNSNDTVTLADDTSTTLQAVTYGSEANSDESIVRDPDFSNAPFVQHTAASNSGGSLYSPGTRISGQAFTVPQGAVILTEVMYDPSGSDGGLEWIELYNTTGSPIDISDMCLGSGGGDYTHSTISLDGCAGGTCTIGAGSTFVVGGPTADTNNANPTLNLLYEISPGLQNSGADADGVALFNLRCSQINATTVPIDAVVYGDANTNGLIDETGNVTPPDVGDVSGGSSIERVDLAGAWQAQAAPNPNVAFPPPPPGGLVITEVFYDYVGTDNGFEWVELCHSGTQAIDLASFSLGYGGSNWTSGTFQLSGTILPGQTIVVGGPNSDSVNGNPSYFQSQDFSPDIQNSGSTGDGVALFNIPAAAVTTSSVPIDAVVYGPNNASGLIDETGAANLPETGDAPDGESIERTTLGGAWQIQTVPNPGTTSICGGNAAPTITITAPVDTSAHPEGTPINFTATANDPEDGDLAASISWSSNLDGALAAGGSFSTSSLSVGIHTITASVIDSGSLQNSDQITLTVEASAGILLSEVFYDASGNDNGLEWIELYNSGSSTVDLSGYSLGAGGADYTNATIQLSGMIQPGQTFVIGGPTSDSSNGNPAFNLVVNFSPDLQNSGSTADGVALFNVGAASITVATVPMDAVVYGGSNTSNLIDETGVANAPELGDAAAGSSIERTSLGGNWQIQSSPTPNASPIPN